MLDQDKRHAFGLTHAISQIEDTFDKLDARFGDLESRVASFGDIENRVASFENVCERLSYRLETTLRAMQEREDNDSQLTRNFAALIATVEGSERKLAHQSERVKLLSDENRALRDTLTAVERDGRLMADEVARLRNELALISRRNESTPPPVLVAAHVAAPAPVVRSAPAESKESPAAVPSGPPASPPAQLPPKPAAVAESNQREGELDQMIADIGRSIDHHKAELDRMQVQAEALLARVAEPDETHRPASERAEAPRPEPAAAARPSSERRLAGIKALSSSYDALMLDLEKSRDALIEPPPADPAPAVVAAKAPAGPAVAVQEPAAPPMVRETPREIEPEEPRDAPDMLDAEPAPELERDREPAAATSVEPTAPAQLMPLGSGNDISKMNSLRAMYEKRAEEMRAELLQERRERQFAESSLQVSRAERLQLQRELAKYRAMSWRRISPEGVVAEPAPTQAADSDGTKRRITAA